MSRDRVKPHVTPLKLPGGATVAVVGEGQHQEALLAVAGPKTPRGERKAVVAVLIAERRTVNVIIDGRRVGHLNQDDARAYAPLLHRATQQGMAPQCEAMVVGGWRHPDGDEGFFGVTLDLAPAPDLATILPEAIRTPGWRRWLGS